MTNGKKPAPGRDEIMRTCAYKAAVAGYYDTSKKAQKANLLTISTLDEASYLKLPPNVTNRFYVLINTTAYHVSRTQDGEYHVEPETEREPAAQENKIREYVLEAALSHYGFPGLYQSKEEMIAAMLEDEEIEDAHPILTELENDPFAALPAGWFPALRSWDVTIGNARCVVGMFPGEDEDSVNFRVVFS